MMKATVVDATRRDATVETGERRAGWTHSCFSEFIGIHGNSSRPRAFASSGMNRFSDARRVGSCIPLSLARARRSGREGRTREDAKGDARRGGDG